MSFLSPSPTRLGLVCLERLTFEADLATRWYERARQELASLQGIELCAVDKPLIELSDADAAITELRTSNIDALIILSGTFALGGLAMRLAQNLPVPLLVWGWPEPAERSSNGTLRLNSLVGMAVNASNLFKLGYRPSTLYSGLDQPGTVDAIQRFARIAGLLRDLKQIRIALIGGHAPGFDNLGVDKLQLRHALGVEVVDVGLQTVVARAKKVAAEQARETAGAALKSFDDTSEITPTQGDLFGALVAALRDFAGENKFDALSIKCWGDLVESYGIAGCGVVSVLNDSGLVTGCEGDIMGTLTTLLAQRLTGTPPFLTDLVSVEPEANTAFLWHIGCAPLCLANPSQPKHLFTHFAGGKGVTAGFGLKPGRVTILRLGNDGVNLRMLATTGTALETEMEVRGTVSRIRFDGSAQAFLDEVLSNGWEHHFVMAYGEILPELELLCKTLKMPLTAL